MPTRHAATPWSGSIAGILSWLMPGVGHLFLGERGRGLVLLFTMTVTFWTGVAIGGVRDTVDPHKHKLWFTAQLGSGGHALIAYGLNRAVASRGSAPQDTRPLAHWASVDVAVHYTGVVGMLNLLVVLDAIGRGDRRAAQVVLTRAGPKGAS